MAGIYGILLQNNTVKNAYKLFFNSSYENIISNETRIDENMVVGRVVLNKFQQDRFFFEDNKIICCFEGICYSKNHNPQSFIKKFLEERNSFLRNLKGVFTGFIYEKQSRRISIFNDHFSTKNLYYYFSKDKGLLFSSRLYTLTKMMRLNDIPVEQHNDGIYSLALYGQLFFDTTIIKDVKKLDYGSILSFQLGDELKLSKEKYFAFQKKEIPISFNRALSEFEELMHNAIKREWNKDIDYGYKHIGLLSGGLDSRVNMMLAKEYKFMNITSLSYGNPDSSDMRIARKIAINEFPSHLTHNIHDGQYLVENIIENYLKLSDGMALYTPSATMRHSLDKVNFKEYGLLHSGQFGGAFFGRYIKPNFDFKKNITKLGWNGFIKEDKMLNNISSLNNLLKYYKDKDYELYAYEQRVINTSLTGDRVANNFVDHLSPFYDIELNEFMLSLPDTFRANHYFYYSWLKKFHPHILDYKWEGIDIKPNKYFKLKYGKIYKYYFNGIKKYMKLNYDSMNPIQTWANTNNTILDSLNRIFNVNIELIHNKKLQEDLRIIFHNDIFEYRNKFSIITILLSLKLFQKK